MEEQQHEGVPDFATPEKQEARALLRKKFLTFVTGIVGKTI